MKTLQGFINRYFKGEPLMVYKECGYINEYIAECEYNDYTEDDIINITYEKCFDCITICVKKHK